jgi:hypothetical protein
LSHPHDKYVVVPTSKAPNNIVFVRKSHYIECLIKELGIDTSLGNPIYPPTTIIGLFCVTLEFQSKMKNWIYLHSTGFLSYISVLTNSVLLLEFPNAPGNLFANY